jgi:penicillin-binding protein 1A
LEGVTEGGSGNRLRTEGGGYGYNRITGYPYKFTNPIAGKTEQHKPVRRLVYGMVPNLQQVFGCEDRSARFKSITYGQGATAAPVWAFL